MSAMLSSYEGEQFQLVEYVHPEDLYRYKLNIQEGLLFDFRNKKVTTRQGIFRISRGRAIFVVDGSGNIYISEFAKEGYFHHSSFLAGRPVAMAGEIWIEGGKIIRLTDVSGHYRPDKYMLDQLLYYLRDQGVDLGETIIRSNKL